MAEPIWIGGAEDVAQVATIVVGNTWATSDTATVTCNGKTLTLTVGATATTTAIATAIKEMINGDTITGDATRSNTGSNIPEFTEMTATVNSSTVTITGDTAGKPFTISVGETTAGTGDLTLTLEATAATGKNHWDNADNWSTGAIPVSTDDPVLDSRASSDILYGFAQSAVTLNSLTITNGFTKKLGLPLVNADVSSQSYPEYRATYLAISATLLSIQGEGAGSGRIKINLGANASTMTISSAGNPLETNVPSLLIQGTHTANIARITRGNVGFAFFDGESAHLATLDVGYEGNQAGDVTVRLGDGVDIDNATITQSGGTLTLETATSTGTITQSGGTLNVQGGAHASIEVSGALYYNGSGTLTTLEVNGGTADFRRGTVGCTVTNCSLGRSSSLYDPGKRVTFTNGIDLQFCSIAELQAFDLGKHLTIQRSAI